MVKRQLRGLFKTLSVHYHFIQIMCSPIVAILIFKQRICSPSLSKVCLFVSHSHTDARTCHDNVLVHSGVVERS